MASIDERVVSMSFVNSKFEAGIATSSASLTKFNTLLQQVGKTHGFADIEKAASKVHLTSPISAFDKLRQRLGGVGAGAPEGFGNIEKSGSKVTLGGPIAAIDKLQSRLGGVGAGAAQGFGDIEKASSKVHLGGLSSAIDSVTAKFSGMTVAFTAAMGTIVTQATMKGQQMVNALTLEPVTSGFQEYTTNLKSIQTILANTKASGTGLRDVNRALDELNTYSDKTIYNFSQMADAIGLFTAAGVDLETSVASVKGLANLAALSGSGMEKAKSAMTQLSQAVAAGKVTMQDWISVRNAGMGGTVFQRALAQTAEAMGTIKKGTVSLHGEMKNVKIAGESFADSIRAVPGEKSWLTSKVLTSTLQQFTGDLSKAELKAQGFNDAQIKSIQATARTAKEAATQVKDLGQVFDVAKEAVGTGWSDTFEIVFGNFTEAKKTFTALSEAINGFLGGLSKARNKMLTEWKELGGRTELIEGLKAAFAALGAVLKPIRDAFREIFPPKTGKDLFELTKRFRNFMESLKIGPETADLLKRTFKGLFAILSIGKTVIFGIFRVLGNLFGVVGKNSKGILGFTATIGDFLVAIDKAISSGEGLEAVFKALETVLKGPLEIIKAVASALGSLFGVVSSSDKQAAMEKGSDALDRLKESLGPLGKAVDEVVRIWETFFKVLEDVYQFIEPILVTVKDAFSKIGDFILDGLKEVNYDRIMTFIQTTFIGGLALGIKKLLGGIGIDLTGGLIDNLKQVTSTLTGTLTTIQKNVNARTMLLIAGAVLALALAATVFAQIDAKSLAKAMAAISVGIAQLSVAMVGLAKIAKGGTFLLLPFVAAGMVGLAAAMVILSGAVLILSKMSWEEIAKGLSGVAGGLISMAVATRFMGPSLILAGPGLVAVSAAMLLLGAAMKIFGDMKWEEIAKGLIAIGGALLVMGLATKAMGPTLLLVGPGLILAAFGLIMLSGAVASFGNMDLSTIAKGILAIGAALLIIGLAISAIPPTIALQAAGLLILALALTGVAAAVGVLGKMDLTTLAKGIAAIAAVLVIFAIGLTAMAGTLPGSIALVAAAGALAILTPALFALGKMSWGTIFKGLASFALIIGVIAVAGLLAAPALTSLAVAMLALGGAVLLVGGGLFLMAKAATLLGANGPKGIGVMVAAITAFIALIPKMVIEFIKGLAEILATLVDLAPKIATNLVKIIGTILNGLVELLPKMKETINAVIEMLLQILVEKGPLIFDAGFKLFRHFLNGVAENIGPIVNSAVQIITRFLRKLAEKAPALVKSGADFLIAWLRGIANNLPRVMNAAGRVIVKFLEGVVNNLPKIVTGAARVVTTFLNKLADMIPRMVRAGTNVIVSILKGIAEAIPRIARAATNVAIKFIRAIGHEGPRLADAGARALIDFLNGLARAIRKNDDAMIDAGFNIADAIVDGIVKGLRELADRAWDQAKKLADGLPYVVRKLLGVASPSKVFVEIGRNVMLGMAVGLRTGSGDVISTMTGTVNDVISKAENKLAAVPDILGNMSEMNPVITPVLDLTQVEKESKTLADLTNVVPITAAASFDQASSISEEQRVSEAAQAEAAAGNVFSFEQNNYSPESLSDIDIYRQTKNQLTQVKDALGIAR